MDTELAFQPAKRDGMSDEPKERSRTWIGWAAIALLTLYPMLLGPAMWLMYRMEDGQSKATTYRTIRQAYTPLRWAAERSEIVRYAVRWYIQIGVPSRTPP
jgi:hypothetical protein